MKWDQQAWSELTKHYPGPPKPQGAVGQPPASYLKIIEEILPNHSPIRRDRTKTPLDFGQKIRRTEGKIVLEAKVRESWELEFWILSQGSRMTVIRPLKLRDRIRKVLATALRGYDDPP